MKKISYIFIFATSLLHTVGYSYVSNKSNPSNLIYCPDLINCSQDGRLDTCKPVGTSRDLQYWNVNEMTNTGRVLWGKYTFTGVSSSYQAANSDTHHAECNYSYQGRSLHLKSIKSAYIEAAPNNSKYWTVSGNSAGCSGPNGSAGSCPLIESGLFIIKEINKGSNLKVKVRANCMIIKEDANLSINEKTTHVSYDEAFPACGGAQQCKFDISIDPSMSDKPTYPLYAGSVIVDMMNDMRIVKVSSNICSGYKMIQASNSVQFEKSTQNSCS